MAPNTALGAKDARAVGRDGLRRSISKSSRRQPVVFLERPGILGAGLKVRFHSRIDQIHRYDPSRHLEMNTLRSAARASAECWKTGLHWPLGTDQLVVLEY